MLDRYLLCSITCISILLCASLVAQPAGLTLISGEAIVSSTDHNMLIQSGEKAILDWTRFSIAENERLHFQQAHAKSAVLNRVSGLEASHILGALSSNGKVYLINPAGIVVGANARIETSGFLASTFDVLNEDFLQERSPSFQGDSEASIVNQGAIQAIEGDIFLVARSVVNEGSLEALEGRVVLEAGCDILLRPEGSQHRFIRTHSLEEEEAALENSGTITAAVAELRATANPYTKAIRQSGKILSIEKSGGKILLVAKEGTCEVSGSIIAQNAGTVHVLGDDIHLLDGAHIDASGEFGGGTVLIGGDYQGKNEAIKNAKHTWVDKETSVCADALRNGNGGKIIFWSDEATLHYGNISARGGEESGDGGLIEVSGKYLDFQGIADRRAPHGQMGLLLLDPINITISGADSANVINPGGGGPYTFSGCAPSPATINSQTLVANLNLGSVTISTSATGGAGCANVGSITISSPITADASANPWSAATTLTLTADAFISISAAITNTSASTGFTAMNFTAGGVGATTNPGISLNAGGNLTTTGGGVVLSGTSAVVASGSHGVFFNGGGILTGSGNILVTGTAPLGITAANISGIQMNTLHGVRTTSGDITMTGNSSSTGGAVGIFIVPNCATTATSGTITLNGNAFAATVGSVGLDFFGTFSANGANIIATGTNNTTGNAPGIQFIAVSSIPGLQTTGNGTITLNGTAVDTAGVRLILATGAISTVNGAINITGTVLGGSGTGFGVQKSANMTITSTTGPITISGTSNTTGAGSHGVSITNALATLTTGLVTFSNCTGGNTGASHGVDLGAAFTGNGPVTFSNCQGGTGGGNGINVTAAFTTTGSITATNSITGRGSGGVGFASSANFSTTGVSQPISITASAIGTTGACHGISLTGGTMNSPSGAITLIGTSGASNAASFGINLASAANSITSTSGAISVSGTSQGTAAGSHGVSIANAWSPGTSGLVTFSNCQGGTGGGNGINIGAAFAAAGNVVATDSITGRGSGGVGFASSANFSTTGSNTIAITASATGTTGACHGISLTGGSMSTNGGGSITLNGTGGASNAASHGINLTGGAATISTTTGNGSISLTGQASGSAASFGINIAGSAASVINSTSGTITISGTSSSTLAGAHGVSIANAWSPGTSGLVTFSNCQGGTGGGNGINVNAAFAAAGNVVATTAITGRGNGGIGFASSANFSTTGSNTIAITASATGTAGTCHGISLTGGSLSTVSGAINLNGTSGASNTASFGVNLSSAANSITSISGPINVIGTSQSTVAGSNGISINTNPWSTGTSATLTLTGTAGSTGASFGIDKGQALTSGGPIVLNGTSSGGIGSYGNRWSGNITTTGDALTVSGSTFLNSAVIVDTTSSAPGGADILFSGSGATIDGAQNLTLFAGTGGAVTFGGAIGQTVALGNLTIASAKTTANAVNIGSNITAGSFTISTVSPVTILGNSIIDVSSTPGGSISFPSTIDGASAGGQALTLTANATGTVTLLGNMGTTTRLGTMTVTGGISGLELGSDVTNIEANSFIVGALTPTTLNNTALLTIDTSASAGGSIAFGGSITGVNASLQSLTLTANATGSVTLSGDVGATRLGALTIGSGTGSFVLGSGITSIQATTLFVQAPAATTLQNTGLLTIDTTGATVFSGTIDGTTNYAQDLTLISSASSITFSDAIGSLVPLGAITVANATDVTASSSIAAASFTQSAGTGITLFNGAIDLTGDVTLTGDNFTFNAPVNSAEDVTITNDGLISIAAAADMTLMGNFQQLGGAGNVHTAGDIATTDHSISFTSPITLTGDVDFTIGGASGDIVFNGTSTTVNGGYNLFLSSNNGGVEFDAAVGTVIPLSSLQVMGPGGILVGANQTVSTGPMSYTGPVTLSANTIFTDSGATGITFSEPGGVAISGNRNLQIWAMNSSVNIMGDVDLSGGAGNNGGNAIFTAQTGITVTGDIDLSGGSGGGDGGSTMFTGNSVSITGDIDVSGGLGGGDGGDASINGQTAITLEGKLITRGGDTAAGTAGTGGMAILISVDGSISIHNIDTSGGSATAAGASGGSAGVIGLMPSNTTGFDNTPAATVIINADLGSSGNLVARGGTGISPGTNGAGALINISANRPAPVSAATITSSLGGNDITIIGRTFTMGMNEVFTTLGNLSITGSNQINMGDTVALLDLTLLAPMINLAIHGTYNILSSLGTLYPNPILHFYAGQALSVTGTLSPSGPIAQTSFASTYTTPEFNDLLIYNSANILNFSTETPPPPPPPTPPPSPSRIPTKEEKILTIYDLNIADIELFYQLPILNVDNYYQGGICNRRCCRKYFTSFIFENSVKEFEERTGSCSE